MLSPEEAVLLFSKRINNSLYCCYSSSSRGLAYIEHILEYIHWKEENSSRILSKVLDVVEEFVSGVLNKKTDIRVMTGYYFYLFL